MNSLSLAFTIVAITSGVCMLAMAIDVSLYIIAPKGKKRWLIGLLLATLLFCFLAVVTNGKDCKDFTYFDYEYGRVPIACNEYQPPQEEK